MGIFSELLAKNSTTTTLSDPGQWLIDLIGGRTTATGVNVNENTALQSTAVFACIRILAETIASLPLPMYKRLSGRGKIRAPDHYLYSVLDEVANSEMDSFVFRETMQGHLGSWGNAYSEIEYDMAGRIRGLWPLRPDKTWPERNKSTGKIEYRTLLPDGTNAILPFERVFHIPGFGFDGLVGYNPIRLFRETIGMALAVEEYGARFFGNGAKPGGVLEHPGTLSKEAQERLRGSWNEMHQGLSKQHRIAILEEGMSYKQIGIPPEDAQFLETRKFQTAEIARIYRIPPHMIGDLERATFSNIEHQSIEFVVHTIRPWLVRWEKAIKFRLLTPSERRRYFAEHLIDGLLRGDIKSRYEAYAIARQNGWMNGDDIRELENMNPMPDGLGEIYIVNGNMKPIQKTLSEGGDSSSEKVLEPKNDSKE